MSLGSFLRALRRSAGYTQEELAALSGVGIRTLRDIERGTVIRPQRATVDLLATALGLEGSQRVAFITAARGAPVTDWAGCDLPSPQALFGREEVLAELGELLDHAPIVTLVGIAGTGKSALALAAAHRFADRYPGGAAMIPVPEAADAAMVLAAVSSAFGQSGVERTADRLAGRCALLIVDGVERSPAAVVGALHRIRSAVPCLRILATGRQPLGMPAEYQRSVPPLDPDAARELFLDRLRRVCAHHLSEAENMAVDELVKRLGGLPYALELAAARGRVLDVTELLARYGNRILDLDPRLRSAVAGSCELLDGDERRILRLLATFAGRWSLELAEALVTEDVVPTVDRLATLGLVTVLPVSELRFKVPRVVREYVLEGLPAGERAELRSRHAALVAGQVKQSAHEFVGTGVGPGRKTATHYFSEIYEEIRCALSWATETKPAIALRIAAYLPRYWRSCGHVTEGEALLRRLLADPRTASVEAVTRAWAQVGIAMLAQESSSSGTDIAPETLTKLEAAIEVFVAAGETLAELQAREVASTLHQGLGNHPVALAHARAAVALAQRSGRSRDMIVAQNTMIWYDIRAGDLPAAGARLEVAERLARHIDDSRLAALVRINMAEVARLSGRWAEAAAIARQSLPLIIEVGEAALLLRLQCTAALAHAQGGHGGEAAAVLAEVRAHPGFVSNLAAQGMCALAEGYVALSHGDRAGAASYFAAAVQLTENYDARDTVEALVGLAVSTIDAEERSATLARLDQVRTTHGMALLPWQRDLLGQLVR